MRFLTPVVVKIVTAILTLLNAVSLGISIYDGETATTDAFKEFMLFQLLVIVFYMIYVASIKWYNERQNELHKQIERLALEQSAILTKASLLETGIHSLHGTPASINRNIDLTNQLLARFSELSAKTSEFSTGLNRELSDIKEEQKSNQSSTNSLNHQLSTVSSNIDKLLREVHIKPYAENILAQIDLLKALYSEKETNTNEQLDSKFHEFVGRLSKLQTELKSDIDKTYGRIDALLSVSKQINPTIPLPVMHNWRVSSDYAHTLITHFLTLPQKTIVDIGSGISTLLLGYLVKQQQYGQVVTLEHDRKYLEQTRSLLEDHGVAGFVRLVHCPLKEYIIDGNKWLWYDISELTLSDVTLVSVDGPPGNLQKNSRFPAVPLLKDYFSRNAVVLMDDADRTDEREIADMYRELYSIEGEFIYSHKGILKFEFKS